MGNNIEILENIMKPYFDKKAEIEGVPVVLENDKELAFKEIYDLKNARISKRKELEVELENLRVRHKIAIQDLNERQEREIDDYINQLMNSNPVLSANYASFVRKDLEQQYKQQYDKKIQEMEDTFKLNEEQLVSKIKALKSVSEKEKNEKQNLERLNNTLDFNRVDLRELVEIKDELRKKLFAERKRLDLELIDLRKDYNEYEEVSLELKEKQLEFTKVMDKLSNFKYEYNDQNQVINNDDWRKLYEESDLISVKIQLLTKTLSEKMEVVHKLNNVKKSLEKVEEYIKLTELTKEETAAVMMSMTPWERKEYDRRKENKKEDSLFEELNFDEEIKSDELDKINIYDASYVDEKDKSIVANESELYDVIYNDIVNEIDNLRTVRMVFDQRLDENKYSFEMRQNEKKDFEQIGIVDKRLDNGKVIELPSGEHVNESDLIEGIENLYKKNEEEGKTYIVKESGKEYKISKNSLIDFKLALKQCSAFKLIKRKAIQKFDLIRVHGKEKTKKFFKKFNIDLAIDPSKTEQIEGNYIQKEDVKNAIGTLISKRTPYWLKNIVEKLRRNDENHLSEDMIDIEEQAVKKI